MKYLDAAIDDWLVSLLRSQISVEAEYNSSSVLQYESTSHSTRNPIRRQATRMYVCVCVCALYLTQVGQALLHSVSAHRLWCSSENPEQMVREKRVTSAHDRLHPRDGRLHRRPRRETTAKDSMGVYVNSIVQRQQQLHKCALTAVPITTDR